MNLPRLVGVVHLPPLPGSPRFAADFAAVVESAAEDARALGDAGFDGVLVENYGDAPFFPERVPPVTVAAMTACAGAVRRATPAAVGVNVLRNDAEAALSVAAATGADFVRVNVHAGVRVTDQGVVAGRAHETLRLRRALGVGHVAILADVDVKHSAPLGQRPLGEQAVETAHRGLADALLVTGPGTGMAVALEDLATIRAAVRVPVYVASGVTVASVAHTLAAADGVIVGSALRADGQAGGRVDPARARAFAEAARRAGMLR